MEPAMSKAARARQRRAATKEFLNSHASELRRLRQRLENEERTPSSPTVRKIETVLEAQHPTEFGLESFAYLAKRSPQRECWHREFVPCGRS